MAMTFSPTDKDRQPACEHLAEVGGGAVPAEVEGTLWVALPSTRAPGAEPVPVAPGLRSLSQRVSCGAPWGCGAAVSGEGAESVCRLNGSGSDR